jgi:threonine-phosphate decarboxylase
MSSRLVRVRELIGWGLDDYEYRPESFEHERLRQAGHLVAQRPPYEQAGAVLAPATAKLSEMFAVHAERADLLAEMSGLSWSLGVVDLRSLIAFQRRLSFHPKIPQVPIPAAREWPALFSLSFGAARPIECEATHDPSNHTLVVRSNNPNLHFRVTNVPCSPLSLHTGGPFVEVACFRGRWFLRDGYHRAYALLNAGVFEIPAVIVHATTIQELGATQPWFFPEDLLFSRTPPRVVDFLPRDLVLEYDRPPLVKTLRITMEESLTHSTLDKQPAPDVARIESYPSHGGQLQQIAERFGIPASELLDFSANINPEGPASAVLSALRASLDDSSVLTEYPDLQLTEIKRAIASCVQVGAPNITVANGFVPLLEAVLRALPIRRCLLPVPSFVEYRKTLARAGVAIAPYARNADSRFEYDPAAMVAGGEDAMLLANPQNPSGICHSAALIRDLVVRASEKKMYILLDEAFIDYVPEHSLTLETDEFPNLIVFRSITKFYGVPGLRVAYAVANPALSAQITESIPPWPVTTLVSRAVSAALGDRPYAERARAQNIEGRNSLQHDLERLGLSVYPSSANFILFRLGPEVDSDAFWQHMIVQHGIVLRACTNYEGLPRGHFRAAVRTREENNRLVEALVETVSAVAGDRL